MGAFPAAPSHGRWEGETLTFHSKTPHGQGRYVYRFEGDRTYHFRIENSFDSGKTFAPFMEATYRKK
jgi:hypothetical protein